MLCPGALYATVEKNWKAGWYGKEVSADAAAPHLTFGKAASRIEDNYGCRCAAQCRDAAAERWAR